jgi:predicted dehydrogenase
MRIAIIGYGYWGPNLLRDFAETSGTEVMWCCDARPERRALAQKCFPAIKVTDDVDQILHAPMWMRGGKSAIGRSY